MEKNAREHLTTDDAASGGRSQYEPGGDHSSPFIPLMLLALGFLVSVGFETTQLIVERGTLTTAQASQESLVQNSQKLRVALETLTKETAKLAEQGNSNAKFLVDELRKRGFAINTKAPEPK